MKRYLIRLALILLLATSILYLIPSFQRQYRGSVYSFQSYPSLVNRSMSDIQAVVPGISESYLYKIESVVDVDKVKDWNYVVSKDQQTLARRVQPFAGNNYEIRLDKVGGKAVFTVITPRNFDKNTAVMTTNNSEFSVVVQDPSTSQADSGSSGSDKKGTDLGLKRSDFGISDINVAQDQQSAQQGGSGVKYEVRLPIGIPSVDKLKLINSKSFSPLQVFVGGKEYSASFLTNPDNGAVTHVVINQITDPDEAIQVQTFFNTDSFNLGYKLAETKITKPRFGYLKLLGLLALFLVGAFTLNRLTVKNASIKKFLYMLAILVVACAAFKLFNIDINGGVILILGTTLLMTLFRTKPIYYLGLLAMVVLTQLMGYLYFFEFFWIQLLIVLVFALLLFSTNYVKQIENKLI